MSSGLPSLAQAVPGTAPTTADESVRLRVEGLRGVKNATTEGPGPAQESIELDLPGDASLSSLWSNIRGQCSEKHLVAPL
jgi:hypothetical protein